MDNKKLSVKYFYIKYRIPCNMQIPAHLTMHSAMN